MLRYVVLVMAVSYGLCAIAMGQGSKRHAILKYTVNNGLSSNNIRHITQDQFGYLWISTQDGLNRSDGKNFTKYTSAEQKSKRTLSMDVRQSALDTNTSLLWVLNNISGINAIDPVTGNVVKEIKAVEKDHDNWNITMACTGQRLWIGGNNGLAIFNTRLEQWETPSRLPFSKNKTGDLFTISTIYAEKDKLWVFVSNYGIVLYSPDGKNILKTISLAECSTSKTPKELHFFSIAKMDDTFLLLGTSEGLKKITWNGGNCKVLSHPAKPACPLNSDKISAITKANGNFYVSTLKGLYQVSPDLTRYHAIVENLQDEEGWFNSVNHLYTDTEENIWAGTRQGLVYIRKDPSPFECMNEKTFPQAKFNQVYFVKPVENGYLIAMEKGLLHFDTLTKDFKVVDGKKIFNYIFKDAYGKLIISADDGSYFLENYKLKSIARLYPELSPFAGSYINSVIAFGDSMYVLGSDKGRGIFLWNYKKRKITNINNSSYPLKLRSNIVNKIFKDSKENIWILSDLGIDILENNFRTITHLTVDHKKIKTTPKLFFDMCETAGRLWITSYGFGLLELDSNRRTHSLLSVQNGLTTDGVYTILPYNNEKLIISTNDGLSVFSIQDRTFSNFYEKDGLHSNAFEENCGLEENGKFYIGGLNGFTIVHPDLLYDKKSPPKIYLSKIRLETPYASVDTANLSAKILEVPNDVVRVTVHFSALYFDNPAKTKIFYKIAEIKESWIDAEGQDFVILMGMPPGKYTISVKAVNENGQWTRQPAKITLNFLPKFYETIWFNVGVGCLLILIFYLLYLYRMRQLKRQQEIRKDIAGDLHDDIGSSLNTVKVFTHLARKEKDNDKYLEEIEATLSQATSGMRDMIWVLDDDDDTWQNLIERIEKFIHPVLSARNIQLVLKVQTEARNLTLNKKEKKNLLLISKETITNCIKYANCKTISLSLGEAENLLVFKIEDDGAGFNFEQTTHGNGLKNIRYRAGQIGFQLKIISVLKGGTSIVLSKKTGKYLFNFPR